MVELGESWGNFLEESKGNLYNYLMESWGNPFGGNLSGESWGSPLRDSWESIGNITSRESLDWNLFLESCGKPGRVSHWKLGGIICGIAQWNLGGILWESWGKSLERISEKSIEWINGGMPRGNIGEFLGESLGNPGGTLRKSLGGLLGVFLGGILGESLGEISCNINK